MAVKKHGGLYPKFCCQLEANIAILNIQETSKHVYWFRNYGVAQQEYYNGKKFGMYVKLLVKIKKNYGYCNIIYKNDYWCL